MKFRVKQGFSVQSQGQWYNQGQEFEGAPGAKASDFERSVSAEGDNVITVDTVEPIQEEPIKAPRAQKAKGVTNDDVR